KIGFINSNVDDSSLSAEMQELISNLADKKPDLITDSKDGVGAEILSQAQQNNLRGTAVYLKPYLSAQSTKEEDSLGMNNFAIIYSNYLERLKHIAKESRLFIVFSANDLHELAMTTV